MLFYVAGARCWRWRVRARAPGRPVGRDGWPGRSLVSWGLSIAFTAFADLQGDGLIGLWLRGSLPAMWQMFCPGLLLAIAPHLPPGRLRARGSSQLPRRAGRCGRWSPWRRSCAGALLGAAAPLRFGIASTSCSSTPPARCSPSATG